MRLRNTKGNIINFVETTTKFVNKMFISPSQISKTKYQVVGHPGFNELKGIR